METKNSSQGLLSSSKDTTTLDLKVIYQPVIDLKLRPNNPRMHSSKQIEQLVKSISQFGFTNPILVDDYNTVIAGHGRLYAAQKMNLAKVPTIFLSGLSESEVRAYVIADNKLADNADWDDELLSIEFQYLAELELDFDLTITGFETAEIDLLIEPIDNEDELDEAPLLPIPETSPVSQLGDLWMIGKHRVFCGDATKGQSYSELLGDKKANLIFTDPPYNVPIKGHVSGLGKVIHAEFKMASGEMSEKEFTDFLSTTFENLINFSASGSIHFICMDWRHLKEILAAGQSYSKLINMCVWVKSNGGMGSLYRSQHELILVFKNGSAPHVNNVELGKHGRYRTNIWQYSGANSFYKERMDDLSIHPTVKPVAMVKDAILDCSNHGGLILDPFGGSGTTLIAAEQAGRIGYLMELDPRYVDTILSRFEQEFGKEAVLTETGQTFSDVMKARLSKSDGIASFNDLQSEHNSEASSEILEVPHE